MSCQKKKCVGSLDKRITIQARMIRPTPDGGYTEDFLAEHEIWANVITKKPFTSMVDIGQDTSYTHIFTIRHGFIITSKNWIRLKTNTYNIVSVENPDEDDRYLKLFAIKKGDSTKKANWK